MFSNRMSMRTNTIHLDERGKDKPDPLNSSTTYQCYMLDRRTREYRQQLDIKHKNQNNDRREWLRTHPQSAKHYHEYHRNYSRLYMPKWRLNIKTMVVKHYSNGTMACSNPFSAHKEPFIDIRALTIDHINNGGEKQKRVLGFKAGHSLQLWLVRNHYPKGYQILCANCQLIKEIERRRVERETHAELV